MLQQTNNSGRIQVMDAIKGLCLLGILVANMLIFQYGIYGKDEMQHFAPTRLDETTHALLKVVVEGSFMPIFMFVFGYGLFKLREGLVQKGLKPGRVLIRRFVMLMGLGLLHSTLLWEGDILLVYGLMGFVLLLFVGRKMKTLLIWASLLMLILAGLSYGYLSMTPEEADRMSDYVQRSITVYGDGSYQEIADFRANEDPLGLSGAVAFAILAFVPIVMVPMFLLGIAAARKQWFHNPLRERSRYAKLAAVLIPLGLLFKASLVIWKHWEWSGVLHSLGSQFLALGYICALALAFSVLSRQFWLRRGVEAVGRMSLTNYLMQTVICTTIFYGYGLGWFGQIGVLQGTLLALIIYAVQAVVSVFLLSYFRNGPIERLLRMWTYFTWSGRARQGKAIPAKPGVEAEAGAGM